MQTLVSVDWLKDHLHDPNLVILDASIPKVTSSGAQPSLYQGQQIKGARFFDIKHSFSDQASGFPNTLVQPEVFERECQKLGINTNSKIIVYDNLGVYSSPRAWWMFRVMGHEQVAVLDGGLPAWAADNQVLQPRQESAYPAGDFQADYQADLISHTAAVCENLNSEEAVVMDARSYGRFVGTTPEPRASLRSGHIPQSINLHYNEVLRDGKFLPKEELAQKISELQLGNRPLIFTCGSGITACIIMLACELVNDNKKAVYDGSWSEWGMENNGLPVEL